MSVWVRESGMSVFPLSAYVYICVCERDWAPIRRTQQIQWPITRGGKATREEKESSKNKIQKPFRAENSVGDSAWTERQRRMKKKRAEGKGRKNVLFKPPARSGPGESVMQAGDRCFGNHTRPREAEFSEICVNVRCLIFPVTLCQ